MVLTMHVTQIFIFLGIFPFLPLDCQHWLVMGPELLSCHSMAISGPVVSPAVNSVVSSLGA